MRGDDWKFLGALLAALVLAGTVVYSSHLRNLRAAAGPTVDIARIEKLSAQGMLSLHEASFWEEAEEGGQ